MGHVCSSSYPTPQNNARGLRAVLAGLGRRKISFGPQKAHIVLVVGLSRSGNWAFTLLASTTCYFHSRWEERMGRMKYSYILNLLISGLHCPFYVLANMMARINQPFLLATGNRICGQHIRTLICIQKLGIYIFWCMQSTTNYS